MNMNRRAGGGFMEAMTALMIATLALSAFLGYVGYVQSQDPPEPEVSTAVLQRLSIEDGKITGLPEDYIQRECASCGYESLVLRVTAQTADMTLKLTAGAPCEDTNVTVTSGTMLLPSDDGTLVLASYEMAVFWI